MSAILCVILTSITSLLLCTTLIAETYTLSVGEKLSFNYFVAGLPFQGEFMVSDSKFELNFDYPEKSTFMVQFDIKQSNAGFLAATKAMLGKRGLDASQFPLASFKSIDVVSQNEKFEILGNLQIKNVSKPIKLNITTLGEYNSGSDQISFLINAKFKRRKFNVNGYYPLVGDFIVLDDKMPLIIER